MLSRNALPQVRKALNRQAATALLGPRQVGKTTLALEIEARLKHCILTCSPAVIGHG